MAAREALLPAGLKFRPSDVELLRHYFDPRTGFAHLSRIFPNVPNLYELNPVFMPPLGESDRQEFEGDGVETIIDTWFVLSTKFVGEVNQVRGGYWRGEDRTYVIDRSQNRPIGFNRVIRFYEGEGSKSFWTSTEVIAPYASATTVVCRLTKTQKLPSFGMFERDAELSYEELIDGI